MLPTLTKTHLSAIMKQFKRFPDQHREICWRFLLALPCNEERVTQYVTEYHLTARESETEVYITANNLQYIFSEMFPISSRTLKSRVEKVCTALFRWSPCLCQTVWLPKFVFPFIKFFGCNTASAFESCCCLLKSFESFVMFRNFLPNRELYIINCIIENFFELPNAERSKMNQISQFNYNHPCMKNMEQQQKYVFGMFTSFFTEQLAGDEWLKLADNIFLNQNVLFVYILMATFTANQLGLRFSLRIADKYTNLQKIDDVLRTAYAIFGKFNKPHNMDVYSDANQIEQGIKDDLKMEAIDDFDKDFDMKQIIQVSWNELPEPINAPKMKVRDMKQEVKDVEKVFQQRYDINMKESQNEQQKLLQSMKELESDKLQAERIGKSRKSVSISEKKDVVTSDAEKIAQVDKEIEMLQKNILEERKNQQSPQKVQPKVEAPMPQETMKATKNSLIKTKEDMIQSKLPKGSKMGTSAQDTLLKRLTEIRYQDDFQSKSGLQSKSYNSSKLTTTDLKSSDGVLKSQMEQPMVATEEVEENEEQQQNYQNRSQKPEITVQMIKDTSNPQNTKIINRGQTTANAFKRHTQRQENRPESYSDSQPTPSIMKSTKSQQESKSKNDKPWQANMKQPEFIKVTQDDKKLDKVLIEQRKQELAQKALEIRNKEVEKAKKAADLKIEQEAKQIQERELERKSKSTSKSLSDQDHEQQHEQLTEEPIEENLNVQPVQVPIKPVLPDMTDILIQSADLIETQNNMGMDQAREIIEELAQNDIYQQNDINTYQGDNDQTVDLLSRSSQFRPHGEDLAAASKIIDLHQSQSNNKSQLEELVKSRSKSQERSASNQKESSHVQTPVKQQLSQPSSNNLKQSVPNYDEYISNQQSQQLNVSQPSLKQTPLKQTPLKEVRTESQKQENNFDLKIEQSNEDYKIQELVKQITGKMEASEKSERLTAEQLKISNQVSKETESPMVNQLTIQKQKQKKQMNNIISQLQQKSELEDPSKSISSSKNQIEELVKPELYNTETDVDDQVNNLIKNIKKSLEKSKSSISQSVSSTAGVIQDSQVTSHNEVMKMLQNETGKSISYSSQLNQSMPPQQQQNYNQAHLYSNTIQQPSTMISQATYAPNFYQSTSVPINQNAEDLQHSASTGSEEFDRIQDEVERISRQVQEAQRQLKQSVMKSKSSSSSEKPEPQKQLSKPKEMPKAPKSNPFTQTTVKSQLTDTMKSSTAQSATDFNSYLYKLKQQANQIQDQLGQISQLTDNDEEPHSFNQKQDLLNRIKNNNQQLLNDLTDLDSNPDSLSNSMNPSESMENFLGQINKGGSSGSL
ncbi:Conserved_hypothetical protein [Hexamita inflata]|uniref:Rab-GAP TBC domain-containing protein n=1 Tax=Hexamita inflata TaxID=28002 RepID=A0AA86QVG7_9EUKA|nr:Conserved hypothetical protein [Hexamita inflata]